MYSVKLAVKTQLIYCFDCQLYTIRIKFVKHNGDVTLKNHTSKSKPLLTLSPPNLFKNFSTPCM